MRKIALVPQPIALAVGLLQDGERGLFLTRKNLAGIETVELPCVLLYRGENPVASITSAFRQQTGIDGQVHEVLFEKRYNAGSKKRKYWIPALVFKITAKSASATPGSGFMGYKWIASGDLPKHRLAKNCEWIR